MKVVPAAEFLYAPSEEWGYNSPLEAEGFSEKPTEVIILAGGLGTRLRSVVPDLPKCMASVNGKPFITYIVEYFLQQGVDRFIFSVGYKYEVIVDYIQQHFPKINFEFSLEEEPLGTGGAIKLACSKALHKDILVTNGDTFFKVDVKALTTFHVVQQADCTLALKPMKKFERYGVVEIDKAHRIQSFKEKNFYTEGLINGGVYILNSVHFIRENLPEKFSFEKDYLEKMYPERKLYGIAQDEYFIDIGIPEDLKRAQEEMKD